MELLTQGPRGTKDILPGEVDAWLYVEKKIRELCERFGFQEIRTPIFEHTELFQRGIGDTTDVVEKEMYTFTDRGDRSITLRPENTAAAVRSYLQNKLYADNSLTKLFYIGSMFRYDRPQKGRYREFWQFDGDIVGSDSLLNEVELMQIVDTVFSRFGVRVQIKINNRKILSGIAEVIGAAEKIVDITVAIDKLDKIGLDNVNQELREDGLSEEQIEKLQPIISLEGSNDVKLDTIAQVLAGSETGLKGVEETRFILDTLKTVGLKNEIQLDLTLARGLNYYTGAIFEVKALDVQIGSITGGGRYDNLTGIFGMPGISGVGISFGVDRIYDVLNALDCYPKDATNGTQLLFINFGDKETTYCLPAVAKAREAGIRTEIFPDSSKMKKQMSYANAKQIPFVALAGENEMAAGKLTLKNMLSGEQQLLDIEELINVVKS